MAAEEGITYDQLVDYSAIDPFKRAGQQAAATTTHNLLDHGYRELEETRGESAYVIDEGRHYRAGVMEGLGTKNLVADSVDAAAPDNPSHYGAIAQDSIAMIVNDLVVCGARPELFWIHVAAGESSWFADAKRAEAFNLGCAAVCNQVGMTWAGGESPNLGGIIVPGTAEISGFIFGKIAPKEHYVAGNNLEAGDAVVLIESSGIHANGLSSARRLSEALPDGYDTKLPDDTTFGETLLEPTHLYVDLVQSLVTQVGNLKRMENITGHGWRKLMRANQAFTYRMHTLPPALPIFDFMQKHLGADDAEMFGNYNQGAGFAIYTEPGKVDDVIATAADKGFKAWHAGDVEAGPKRVIIEPKGVTFEENTLGVR